VESEGMLCSARELGLSDDHSGVLELPADASVGAALVEVMGGADKILEVEITPNRGDCLSVLGIARELGTLYDLDLHPPDCSPIKPQIKDILSTRIEASDACPVFAGRIIRGLRAGAVTPLWMRERLRRAGLRSLHPVVDVTQYVMLELGQPMHAYDLRRLSSGIVVRMAKAGESLNLLGGNAYVLEPNMLVVADHQHALGAGGIMGGADSGVQAGSTDIYLEAAFFTPDAISGRSRKLGLKTDAAYRFERGVDPTGQARALERATRLLQAIAGGQPGPVSVTETPQHKTAMRLKLRRARLEQLLGLTVPEREVVRILRRLEFAPAPAREGWQVTVPRHRFDIELEENLVEEVGRVFGYDHIPAVHYPSAQRMPPLPEERVPLSRLRDTLIARGYQEVITYSFVDSHLQQLVTGEQGIALANPITVDMAEMRRSLWPGLIQTLRYNLNRQQPRARIFESGMRFLVQSNEIKQENVIAGLIYGPQYPLQWGLPHRISDLADLRSDVEALLVPSGAAERLEAVPSSHPALHPGQSALLRLDGANLGWLGALHPALQQKLDMPEPVFVFELCLGPILQAFVPAYMTISQFPSISRDLAIVVDEELGAARILAVVRQAAGPLAAAIHIFDIYKGTSIDSRRKSVALSLILQDSSRTLTDEAADATIAKIVERLRHELGATIRD
jgi:phenylalanyl-tRNA synthetase beta chain